MTEPNTVQTTAVTLSNGTQLLIRSEQLPESDLQARGLNLSKLGSADFGEVGKVIEGIAADIMGAIQSVRPAKTTLEFGLELRAQTGGLLSMLAQGGATGDLKLTLEW